MRKIEEIARRDNETTVRFFISANSGNGFYSLYDRVFQNESFEKIYVIQGGPGTGKSTLMQSVCAKAEKDGAICEGILCSSDPDSLDGVIIKQNGKQIGVLDGTAPHPRILSLPGVKEEIWNLGTFWDEEKLSAAKDGIYRYNAAKTEAYRHAYALLHAASTCHASLKKICADSTDLSKMRKQINNAFKNCSRQGETQKQFFRAYSMRGEMIERSLFSRAKNKISLCGKKHSAEVYLGEISQFLARKNIEHTDILSPLSDKDLDAVYIPERDLLITWHGYLSDAAIKKIHLNRFQKESPFIGVTQRHGTEKLEEALLDAALDALREAGRQHFALESIYKSAMHFESSNEESEKWTQKALATLKK